MASVFKTASFKLHNPSRRKRNVLEETLREYTLAYQTLLDWAAENRELIEAEGRYETASGKLKWTNVQGLSKLLNRAGIRPAIHSSLRDALVADVAENLLSYFALKDHYQRDLAEHEAKLAAAVGDERKQRKLRAPFPPGFPVARSPLPGAFEDALDAVANLLDVDEDMWLGTQARLTRLMRGRYMPLFFNRPDAVPRARNFSLLVDAEKGRYYGLMYLLPDKHPLGWPLETTGNLRRVGRPSTAGEDYRAPALTSRTSCAILCPLEMGRWHMEEFILHPASNPRTAILVERDGEYFLNVTFEFLVPDIQPERVIGIDRGIAQLAALRVLDMEGHIVGEEALWPGDSFLKFQWEERKRVRRLQRRGKDVTGRKIVSHVSDEMAHTITRRIAEVALEHRAQVVMESLKGFDRAKATFGRLRAAPYQKIGGFLGYKLLLRGLPPLAEVSPAWTSLTCPNCMNADKANRPTQESFECATCGYTDHADLNAAANIARRWLARQREEDWWPTNQPKRERKPLTPDGDAGVK